MIGPIKDEYDDDSVHDDVADMLPEWSKSYAEK
jgi:hypothetical protein